MVDLQIITPNKMEKEIQADMIVIPAQEGEMGILAGHIPILVKLQSSGTLKLYKQDKLTEEIAISDGICEVKDDICRILVDSLEAV